MGYIINQDQSAHKIIICQEAMFCYVYILSKWAMTKIMWWQWKFYIISFLGSTWAPKGLTVVPVLKKKSDEFKTKH